jgi:manganese transport protein
LTLSFALRRSAGDEDRVRFHIEFAPAYRKPANYPLLENGWTGRSRLACASVSQADWKQMRKVLGITLGIMTALGGFVDFGQIVFTLQAGASFRYALLWPIVLETIAIILYMEICGRIAVASREPVFAVVRDRLGNKLGLAVLAASNLLNLITCAAELGGVAILLHLLTDRPEKALLVGVAMAVAAVAAWMLGPNWNALGRGLIPRLSMGESHQTLRYWFFAVGIFSAMLMEYEVHFYSSGALEEDWSEEDLPENFMVASFGSILGATLTVALLAIGALVFSRNTGSPNTSMRPSALSQRPLAGRDICLRSWER